MKLLDHQLFKMGADVYIYFDRHNPDLNCIGDVNAVKNMLWTYKMEHTQTLSVCKGTVLRISTSANLIRLKVNKIFGG